MMNLLCAEKKSESGMNRIYDARGNVYAVVTPQTLRAMDIPVPESVEAAASLRREWTGLAVQQICEYEELPSIASQLTHCTDGLLVGPFQDAAPFDLLIVNTDGTLAERSGNGLTIFAQALTDQGLVSNGQPFMLRVHHDKTDAASPVQTQVQPTTMGGDAGFWLDLGRPQFGPEAVSAQGPGVSEAMFIGAPVNRVDRLSDIDEAWSQSVFVRIGNPHCVTLVCAPEHLPSFARLQTPDLHQALARIAFSDGDVGLGDPCAAGVNLQWASVTGPDRIEARVFERGEGATASSGTSASAVACAAWKAGRVQAGLVEVVMPGGTAPIRLTGDEHALSNVALFGVARPAVQCLSSQTAK